MKSLGILVAVAGLGLASPALAQSSTSGTSPATPAAPSASAQPGAGMSAGQNSQAAAQKIKQDLQSAGFKDVNVVAQSFVVQAKTKDGNPVVMTIGPHGMSVLEAMNSSSGNSTDQTGSINQNNSQKQ